MYNNNNVGTHTYTYISVYSLYMCVYVYINMYNLDLFPDYFIHHIATPTTARVSVKSHEVGGDMTGDLSIRCFHYEFDD